MNDFGGFLDNGFKLVGILLTAAIVIFLVKNASQLNTLATSASSFVTKIGSV